MHTAGRWLRVPPQLRQLLRARPELHSSRSRWRECSRFCSCFDSPLLRADHGCTASYWHVTGRAGRGGPRFHAEPDGDRLPWRGSGAGSGDLSVRGEELRPPVDERKCAPSSGASLTTEITRRHEVALLIRRPGSVAEGQARSAVLLKGGDLVVGQLVAGAVRVACGSGSSGSRRRSDRSGR